MITNAIVCLDGEVTYPANEQTPVKVPVLALTFLNVYNELVFANTLLQRKSMMTISVTLLGLKGERFTSWGVMFAAIVLSILPILIVYLLMQEKIEAGVTNGAVKG